VTRSSNTEPVTPGAVSWTITGNSESVTAADTTTVTIDDTTYYLSRIHFETRRIDGLPDFPATPDTLELTESDTTYTRRATVELDGAARPATLPAGRESFLYGAARQGLVERLDLVVGETYDEWSQRIFGELVDAGADADADGRSNGEEFLQGTDPLSAASFSILREFAPAPAGGFTITWDSRPGREYLVEWSDRPAGGTWQPAGPAVPGTGDPLSHTHPAGNASHLFFRITVQ
jgi:hypothetical protein